MSILNNNQQQNQDLATQEVQNKLIYSNKNKLDERDLLTLCVEQPKYLSKALGHDSAIEGGTGLETTEQKKEMLKYFYKAWSGLTKFIYNNCIVKNICVEFPLIGKFIPQSYSNENENENNKQIVFVPLLDFLASGRFQFPQNQNNISPLSKKVPKYSKSIIVSLGQIGQSCEFDRDLVASILKDVFVKLIEQNRKGKEVVLDLKIGVIHAYPNGEIQFETHQQCHQMEKFQNYEDKEVDQINNKRYISRKQQNDNDYISEQNLENLARAMSQGAQSVNMKSCFQSVKTPQTQYTSKSQLSKISGISRFSAQQSITKNWYNRDPFVHQTVQSQKGKNGQIFINPYKDDIYSTFSKKTAITYLSIKNRTESRIEQEENIKNQQTLESLQSNQYLPNETLEQFMSKKGVGFRPKKRLFYEQKPSIKDKKDILNEYLRDMHEREIAKQLQRVQNIDQEKKIAQSNLKIVKEQIQKDNKEKEEKIQKMVHNINLVKEERLQTIKKERDYRMNQAPITQFPYTHGDVVEAQRAQIKEELQNDLKNRYAELNQKKESTMNEYLNQSIERETRLYPQGGEDKVILRGKFQESIPFYLKSNKPIQVRKTNQVQYQSAIEQARERFEKQLQKEKDQNKKDLDQYMQYMDETSKFNELKEMRNSQLKLLNKSVLRQQMEEDRIKKLQSQQNRRSTMGGEITFGPKETENTIVYQHLKKHHDQKYMKDNLIDQITKNQDNELMNQQRYIVMDRNNVNMALREVRNQQQEENLSYQNQKQQLKNEWKIQNGELQQKSHLQRQFIEQEHM